MVRPAKRPGDHQPRTVLPQKPEGRSPDFTEDDVSQYTTAARQPRPAQRERELDRQERLLQRQEDDLRRVALRPDQPGRSRQRTPDHHRPPEGPRPARDQDVADLVKRRRKTKLDFNQLAYRVVQEATEEKPPKKGSAGGRTPASRSEASTRSWAGLAIRRLKKRRPRCPPGPPVRGKERANLRGR